MRVPAIFVMFSWDGCGWVGSSFAPYGWVVGWNPVSFFADNAKWATSGSLRLESVCAWAATFSSSSSKEGAFRCLLLHPFCLEDEIYRRGGSWQYWAGGIPEIEIPPPLARSAPFFFSLSLVWMGYSFLLLLRLENLVGCVLRGVTVVVLFLLFYWFGSVAVVVVAV